MAGLIRDDDIALVRERARIDEVVSNYVTLKHAGGGSQKGLFPFHDEKSASFNVNPSRGFFHCLAGETEVMTWEGVRPIRELAGGIHKVLNVGADWVEAPFASYGVQRLHKITLTSDRQSKEPAPSETLEVMEASRRNGVLVGKGGTFGNCIRITPPLNISKTDVDEFARLLDRSFTEANVQAGGVHA